MSAAYPSSRVEAPPLIGVDFESGKRLSVGNDSDVYRFGDVVAKVYKKLSFDEVARYVALQNAAVDALKRLRYRAEVRIRGVPHTITAIAGVPVYRLGVSRAGRPVTLSRYVAAPNLEKIMFRPEAFAKYADAELTDPRLREFGSDLNFLFWNEYPTRVQDEFHYHLCMLSRLLDRELGVGGLYIGKYNAKLRPVEGKPRIDLIITDISVYIDRIEYGANGHADAATARKAGAAARSNGRPRRGARVPFPGPDDAAPLTVDPARTYVVRYLNPTANKPLHLGHLRNVVLGAAASASLEALGARVVRHCVVEDTGRYMSEAMIAVRDAEREHDVEALAATYSKPDHFIGACYAEHRRRRRAQAAEPKATPEYPARNDAADDLNRALAGGDVHAERLWRTVRTMALDGQQATLRRLGIAFDCCDFESAEDAGIDDFIADGLERGLLRRNGAGEVVFVTASGRELRFVNSAGMVEESARLLSMLRRLLAGWSSDRVNVIVAGSEWKRSMSAYPETLGRLGVRQGDGTYAQAFYGMVMLNGKKMASSAGTGVLIDDLLDEVAGSAQAADLAARSGNRLGPDELAATVVKSLLLSFARTDIIDFDAGQLYDRARNPGWKIAEAWAAIPHADVAELGPASPGVRELLADALARISFERVVERAGDLAAAILGGCGGPNALDDFRTVVRALSLAPASSSFDYRDAPSLMAIASGNGHPLALAG
ncbi:MAG: arginine--tRNA ligase [Actinomycetota bacterium]|nr:arginine--tRNA ligase [Actinomycetota bacterium]